MTNPITKTFIFEGKPIRMTTIEGKDWFASLDILRALGYPPASHAIMRKKLSPQNTLKAQLEGYQLNMVLVSKEGLLQLVHRSYKGAAPAFLLWITETLPSEAAVPAISAASDCPDIPDEILTATLKSLEAILRKHHDAIWRAQLAKHFNTSH